MIIRVSLMFGTHNSSGLPFLAFKKGDQCRATYSGDGLLYAGIILDIVESDGVKSAVVEFTGYDTQEQVAFETLLPPEEPTEESGVEAKVQPQQVPEAGAAPVVENNGVDSKVTTVNGSLSSSSGTDPSDEASAEAVILTYTDPRTGQSWKSGNFCSRLTA